MLNYLVLNFLLFCIGIFGVILNRQNLLTLLMAIELMLLAVNLNFLLFAIYLDDVMGEVFMLVILAVAAAESSLGLAIIIMYARTRGSISVWKINLLSL